MMIPKKNSHMSSEQSPDVKAENELKAIVCCNV